MVKTRNQQIAVVACVIAASLAWFAPQTGQLFWHRRLEDMIKLHEEPPQERNAVPSYNLYELPLMQSPCRPEPNGYFGSTSGPPLDLQYGFEMETTDGDIEHILQEIQEEIIDDVLSSAFSSLCGFRRRTRRMMEKRSLRQDLRANQETGEKDSLTTGFHFGMDITPIHDTCTPQVSATNACSIYVNPISIFGSDLEEVGVDVLVQVKETINMMGRKLAREGVARLTVVDELTTQIGKYRKPEYSESGGLSPGVKTAIALSTIALVACLAAILLYIIVDRRSVMDDEQFIVPMKKDGNMKLGIYSSRTDRSDDGSNVTENVGFHDGPSVVLGESGRPVVIEFQNGLDTIPLEDNRQGDFNNLKKSSIKVENLEVITNNSEKDHFSRPSDQDSRTFSDHGSRVESLIAAPQVPAPLQAARPTPPPPPPPPPPPRQTVKATHKVEVEEVLSSDDSYYTESYYTETNSTRKNTSGLLAGSPNGDPYDENSVTDSSRYSKISKNVSNYDLPMSSRDFPDVI